MVKGISKNVVVVKSPQNDLFEEAIFILKEDSTARAGVDAEHILREACAVANEYVTRNCGRHRKPAIPAPLYAAAGAGMTGILWLLSMILQ